MERGSDLAYVRQNSVLAIETGSYGVWVFIRTPDVHRGVIQKV